MAKHQVHGSISPETFAPIDRGIMYRLSQKQGDQVEAPILAREIGSYSHQLIYSGNPKFCNNDLTPRIIR